MEDELKSKLIEKYPYRLEMHAHTSPASPCGDVLPENLVKIFAEKGYAGIAMTNHLISFIVEKNGGKEKYIDFILGEFEKAQNAAERYGVKVYLGAELRFEKENGNDYLLYGIDRDILSSAIDSLDGTLELFSKNYKSDKSILIQAHPFRDGQVHDNTDFIDGVEVFNLHPHHNSRIALATKWANENGMLKACGTDYHHLGHDNLCATRSSFLPNDSFDIVKMYKDGAYIFEIGSSLILP